MNWTTALGLAIIHALISYKARSIKTVIVEYLSNISELKRAGGY